MRRAAIHQTCSRSSLRAASLPSFALLAACASSVPVPEASPGFEIAPSVRALVDAVAPARPERALRAYALRIDTVGAGAESRVDVIARQARDPRGALVAVTGSQGAGAFGMARSIGLCGLVSLRLDTTRADRAYLPGDPARAGDIAFTDEAALDVGARMWATGLRVDGTPCAPRPGEGFSLALQTRSAVGPQAAAGQGHAVIPGPAAEVRYECRAAASAEPARLLHPGLAGEMLRVECLRDASAAGADGQLAYAWIASSGVYLLTAQRGPDITQRYVYTDVVLAP